MSIKSRKRLIHALRKRLTERAQLNPPQSIAGLHSACLASAAEFRSWGDKGSARSMIAAARIVREQSQ